MKTSDFNSKLTSSRLKENITKQFGVRVNLEKYNREQLEDMRNKLRTRIFQQEGSAGINDLLTNEAYQKDKAMLELLNTRIKEMLGEQMKLLRDKLDTINEGKKGVKVAKHPRGAKGSDGNLANNYPPFDKVTRGDVIAGATGKDQKGGKAKKEESVEEGFDDLMKATKERNAPQPSGGSGKKQGPRYGGSKQKDEKEPAKKESKIKEAAKSCNHTAEGKMCEVHGKKACPMDEAMKMVTGPKGKKVPAFAADGKGKKDLKKSKMAEMNSIFRRHVKIVNESLQYLINEDEEEKAQAITSAGDMANDFTGWMQRVGQYQTKVMIELSDEIRHNFGPAEAEAFKQAVSPALAATLETLTAQREVISNAIAQLAGGQVPEPMGAPPAPTTPEMPVEPSPELAGPDTMNTGADEFAASDAAAGAGASGREIRENRFVRKLAEAHSIISKLAK